MAKFIFILTLTLTVAGAVISCSAIDEPTEPKKTKVAMVLPGNITDKSWNQAGYEGLQRAKQKLGIEVAFSEMVSQPDQLEALTDFARRGYSIVIGHGGEFQEAATVATNRYPKTFFIVTNGTSAVGNLSTVSFKYRQAGYLVGYLSGLMSESKRAGFIGAQKIYFSTELEEGYRRGFLDAAPNGQIFVTWTNDWNDIAKGKEAALGQIDKGADIIFPTMDNGAIGSLQAAKERNTWAIGLYYDAIIDWPDTVLQSAILNIQSAIVLAIADIQINQEGGNVYEYGVDTPEVLGLGTFHPKVSNEFRDRVLAQLSTMKHDNLAIE